MTAAVMSLRPGATCRRTVRPRPVRERSAMKLFYGWIIVGAGIVITCLGIGTMMTLGIFLQPMSPRARWLITEYGWRSAMLVLGALCWLLIIPTALLVRKPPALPRAAAATASAAEREFTVAQALRTPEFAAIAFTYFACCAAHS